ncbi:hypothetical protein HPG27_295 [Helicobacter pylori G27]|uniref:Uncharacterized protein n=2 Tax=Helicobacter pylori TaxID=210 RepID=B5ZA81_HELPG|nr:hypothetical protein HPG27_295 [Helicobacter pylori G27]EJB69944.1 hypothetical protein HPHPH45_0216 [Helicobacter pylori Hp H-45]
MKTTAKKPYSSRSLVFMKRFRHKLCNANNQLFFLNRGASLMIRVLIKNAP